MAVMIKNNKLEIFKDAKGLIQFAAQNFCERAIAALKKKNEFVVVLSGGNTPILFYDTLASHYRDTIPWNKIKFYFGDERYVPSDDDKSNYHQADIHLFQHVPVDPNNIFKISTEWSDPNEAARHYANQLRGIHFDLVYLGLGSDAHTASLMPDTKLVQDIINHTDNAAVAALYVPQLEMYRITLTPVTLNNASEIIFLVIGDDKASAVYEVLRGDNNALHYPAKLINCLHGRTSWFVDRSAGKLIF